LIHSGTRQMNGLPQFVHTVIIAHKPTF
jgi:hypothetical protein